MTVNRMSFIVNLEEEIIIIKSFYEVHHNRRTAAKTTKHFLQFNSCMCAHTLKEAQAETGANDPNM